MKNFFGFTDKLGEGINIQVLVMHDKSLDQGTNYIAFGGKEIKIF